VSGFGRRRAGGGRPAGAVVALGVGARAAVALAACSLVGLALAGCGSTPLSLIQLRARAGAICTVSERRAAAIRAPRSPARAGAFLVAGIRTLEPEVRQLARLSAPAGTRSLYRGAIASVRAELSTLRGAVASLRAGGAASDVFGALERRLAPLERRADGAWRALGMPACARD